ncbi:mammalian cell entry protein [Mycolicibacillus trivialis]
MSPRRRVDADATPARPDPAPAAPATPRPPLRMVWTGIAATVAVIAALAIATVLLVGHESRYETAMREDTVLEVARSFTIQVMSPDPTGDYGANRYVDRMTEQVTGELETYWRESRDQILIQVAKGPKSEATILYAGLERWNDDGSADVLVIAKQSIKDDDDKTIAEPIAQLLETVRQEGGRWKISNMGPVL